MVSPASSVLFLTHRVPYPPDKGDRIRTYHILRYLAARANVLLGCVSDEPVPSEHLQVLRDLCADVCVVDNTSPLRWWRGMKSFAFGRTVSEGVFSHPRLMKQIRQWRMTYDVKMCLASASSLAPYLDEAMNPQSTVVDLIDVDSQKWLDYAAVLPGWRRWLYRREGERLRRTEQELARRLRALTLVSEAECRLLRSFCTEGEVLAVPNGVDLEYFVPVVERPSSPTCVFVGAMDYPPNIDACVWFAEHVWPAIRRTRSDAQFHIVGRKPTDAVKKLGEVPGITVVGQVPDVREHVAQASVVVAPLRIARGIQNKVLEALAMAQPVIASAAAMEGLAVADGRELARADTPEEWTQSLLALWNDAARRTALGDAGRRYVETHHSWDQCLKSLGRLLELEA